MRPIPTEKHQAVLSLLLEGLSSRKITRKVGVGKTTVERIRSEVEPNKENIKTGRPRGLSDQDRRRLVNEIESGKVDNAVQATKLINSVLSTPVSVQTVRNSLKQEDMVPVVKTKQLLLKAAHRKARLAFAHKYKNWTVDIGRGYCGQMRLKPIKSTQMVEFMSGKRRENHFLIGPPPPPLSSMEEETSWYGAVWVGIDRKSVV